jgi:hypothetical protein
LSEEFGGALPSVIWKERSRLPVGFLEAIIEARAYAAAVAANESDPKGWGSSVMRTTAKEIELALAAEEIAQR